MICKKGVSSFHLILSYVDLIWSQRIILSLDYPHINISHEKFMLQSRKFLLKLWWFGDWKDDDDDTHDKKRNNGDNIGDDRACNNDFMHNGDIF